MSRTLIAACGNADAGDDAFGLRVASMLARNLPPDVELAALGARPAALLDRLPGPARLILVDAIRVDEGAMGSWYEIDLRREPLPPLAHDLALSSHALGLAFQLSLAERLRILPDSVLLFGAAARFFEIGSARTSFSDEIVHAVATRILELAAAPREPA